MVKKARFHPYFFLFVYSKMAVELIQNSGRLCVLDVEINGVKNIKQTDLNAKYVFVKPPSLEDLVSCFNSLDFFFAVKGKQSWFICSLSIHINFVLFWPKVSNGRQWHFSSFFFSQRKRLEGRGTETKESLQKRLDTAQEALEYGRVFFLSVLIFPELLLHKLQLGHGIFQFLTYETINKQWVTIHVPVKAATVWTTDQYAIWNQWKL